jgi:shikimate kinase
MNIIFIGFPKSGKSTFGRKAAETLSIPFFDVDEECSRLHAQQGNDPLSHRDIFTTYGEEYFRGLEKDAVAILSQKDDVVIATGGGTLFYNDNYSLLRPNGYMIYLETPKSILVQRMKEDGLPAFLNNTYEAFEEMYLYRKPLYEEWCDTILHT